MTQIKYSMDSSEESIVICNFFPIRFFKEIKTLITLPGYLQWKEITKEKEGTRNNRTNSLAYLKTP